MPQPQEAPSVVESSPAATALRTRMASRATDEPHRTSSQLELLFDLTFVVAVASITAQLGHAIADGHGGDAIVPFLQVFFAIWWAWMNFTWFASSYDCDDVPYRLLTLVQMAGVLVLAAGVPAAVEAGDFRAITIGYLVMRTGLVAQWLRAAIEDPAGRATALRYAVGIAGVEVGWIARLVAAESGTLTGDALLAVFGVLVLIELAVPAWAERARPTTWHPHHIAERYGLFTIILLGEGVLAASTGVEGATAHGGVSVPLLAVSASGLVLVFALWWLSSLQPAGEGLSRRRDRSYLWGYGHFGIFAALAALGAGLEVAVEQTGHHLDVSSVAVGYAVALPVAVFLVVQLAVYAPLVNRLSVRPAISIAGSASVLLLPLAADSVGAVIVVAGITAVVCGVVAATLATTHP